MKESEIKKLIKLVKDSEIDQLEISRWGRKIKITRRLEQNNGQSEHRALFQSTSSVQVAAPPQAQPTAAVSAVDSTPTIADKKYVEIKSPMVGTFYAAPAPDAPPYTKVGDRISVGQVVCIIEAMKLMNEIESEVSGTVARIMVENAKPVEFGQVLFLIDPA